MDIMMSENSTDYDLKAELEVGTPIAFEPLNSDELEDECEDGEKQDNVHEEDDDERNKIQEGEETEKVLSDGDDTARDVTATHLLDDGTKLVLRRVVITDIISKGFSATLYGTLADTQSPEGVLPYLSPLVTEEDKDVEEEIVKEEDENRSEDLSSLVLNPAKVVASNLLGINLSRDQRQSAASDDGDPHGAEGDEGAGRETIDDTNDETYATPLDNAVDKPESTICDISSNDKTTSKFLDDETLKQEREIGASVKESWPSIKVRYWRTTSYQSFTLMLQKKMMHWTQPLLYFPS